MGMFLPAPTSGGDVEHVVALVRLILRERRVGYLQLNFSPGHIANANWHESIRFPTEGT